MWLKPNTEKPPEGGWETPTKAAPDTRPARAGLNRSAESPLKGAEEPAVT
jgi:hypothetical protein